MQTFYSKVKPQPTEILTNTLKCSKHRLLMSIVVSSIYIYICRVIFHVLVPTSALCQGKEKEMNRSLMGAGAQR